MGVERRIGVGAEPDLPRRLEHQQLLWRVGEVVLTPHDVGDRRIEVVDCDSEVVEDRPVGAGDDGIVHVDVLEGRVSPHHVVDDSRSLVWNPQADGPGPLILTSVAPVGSVQLLVGPHVLSRRVGAIGPARLEQSLERLLVAFGAVGLHRRDPRPSRFQASAGHPGSARCSRASSAPCRCPRCAAAAFRPHGGPAAS